MNVYKVPCPGTQVTTLQARSIRGGLGLGLGGLVPYFFSEQTFFLRFTNRNSKDPLHF